MEYDNKTNRTLDEMQAIIKEYEQAGKHDKISFAELVRNYDGTYYLNIVWNGKRIEGLPEYVDFKTLKNACKNAQGGTVLPPLKYWIFKQRAYKQYAYLQAMVTAKSCMVEQ